MSVLSQVVLVSGKACARAKKKRNERLSLEGWRREEVGVKRNWRAGKGDSASCKHAASWNHNLDLRSWRFLGAGRTKSLLSYNFFSPDKCNGGWKFFVCLVSLCWRKHANDAAPSHALSRTWNHHFQIGVFEESMETGWNVWKNWKYQA